MLKDSSSSPRGTENPGRGRRADRTLLDRPPPIVRGRRLGNAFTRFRSASQPPRKDHRSEARLRQRRSEPPAASCREGPRLRLGAPPGGSPNPETQLPWLATRLVLSASGFFLPVFQSKATTRFKSLLFYLLRGQRQHKPAFRCRRRISTSPSSGRRSRPQPRSGAAQGTLSSARHVALWHWGQAVSEVTSHLTRRVLTERGAAVGMRGLQSLAEGAHT